MRRVGRRSAATLYNDAMRPAVRAGCRSPEGRKMGALILQNQITIRVKLDSAIKRVKVELPNHKGVITTDGRLYKRNEYSYVERIWCHYCRNNDHIIFVETMFGKRARCKACKPKECCSIPGCAESVHSIHRRDGETFAYCYVHWRKSQFFDPEGDAYDGISDEGVIASERLWREISNRRQFTKGELEQYDRLLESYRVHPARW